MSLCVAYTTSRNDPKIEWFLDSLRNQGTPDQIIIVDFFADKPGRRDQFRAAAAREIVHVTPKPSVWQGKHKLTKDEWWAKSNALNTAICLCRTDWIAFVDDRSVLLPGWLNCVTDAIDDNYAVFGSYEKRTNMVVSTGIIKSSIIMVNDKGEDIGVDDRVKIVREFYKSKNPLHCPWDWAYGCTLALPLEWALTVNGFDETCDGASAEDTMFGAMLLNNNYPMKYDLNMKIIEDRTPAASVPVMARKDKGVSPNDKSHAQIAMLKDRKRAKHQWDLRAIRQRVLRGEPFPIPIMPTHDWYDFQPLSEMTPP